jgi:hypothetical protein
MFLDSVRLELDDALEARLETASSWVDDRDVGGQEADADTGECEGELDEGTIGADLDGVMLTYTWGADEDHTTDGMGDVRGAMTGYDTNPVASR